MIFIRSYLEYSTIGLLLNLTDRLVEMKEESVRKKHPEFRITGVYIGFDSKWFIAIIKNKNELYLRVNELIIPWADIRDVCLEDMGKGLSYINITTSKEIIRIQYVKTILKLPLSNDFEPFSELEDYDFGLFIKNLFENPDRCQRIYSQ